MKHYAGLDVSVKETAFCIVDETGRICRETKVISHPEDLSKALAEAGFRIERIGLAAGLEPADEGRAEHQAARRHGCDGAPAAVL